VSDAVATGLIGLGGVALGLLGTAAIQWVTQTTSRRDAAHERQAALLRELQEVLEEFNRQWTDLIHEVAQGKAHLTTLDLDSKPSLALSRYRVLTRRVTDEGLRRDLESVSSLAFQLAASGSGGDISKRVSIVQDRLGEALRREL
jgi:hypothetical protein